MEGVDDAFATDQLTVSGPLGSITVPAQIVPGMVDGVVWLPTNSVGCHVRTELGVEAGQRVSATRSATNPVTEGASA